MSRSHNTDQLQARNAAKSWADTWQDTKGGFNPDVFKNLDDVTRQKLLDYQIGPPIQMGDKLNAGSGTLVGHWSDGDNYGFHNNPEMNAAIYGDIYHHGTNRGSVQNAVWEMGLPNIETPEHLTQFLDRTDALTAKHGNFLEDGWDPKDILLYREAPQQAVATADPVVDTPVATAVDVPEVVEQESVPKEPIEGVDYMSPDMKNTYDQMQDEDQDYPTGFNAEDWIARISEPDTDPEKQAQNLVDKWTFEINELRNNSEEEIEYKNVALAPSPWDIVHTGDPQEDHWVKPPKPKPYWM